MMYRVGVLLPFLVLVMLFATPVLASLDLLLQQAVADLEAGRNGEALELLQDVARRHPEPDRLAALLAAAWRGVGFDRFGTGDYPGAIESFQEGRRYRDDDPLLWLGEALAWYRQGRYATAAATLDQALGHAPENADLHLLLGRALYADGQLAESYDALERAVELGSEPAIALRDKVRSEWQHESRLQREARGHFELSYAEGRPEGLAGDVLDVLEGAYAELGAALDFYPDVKVPVLLYERAEFAAATSSPDWAGALFDGKIRVPLAPGMRMNAALEALLHHEYAHVVVHFLADRKAPAWLNEGIAEVSGRRILAAHSPVVSAGARLLDWERLAQPFAGLVADEASRAYAQSHALVAYLVDRYGWHVVREILVRLGRGESSRAACDAALAGYGIDWPALLAEWRAGLN